MPNRKLLSEIVAKKPQDHLFVFDLDSTLFDVSYRTQAILENFIENPELRNKHSQIDILKKVQVQPGDWGLKTAVQRSVTDLPQNLINDLKKYWQKHFFSNAFLKYDVPYTNAQKFLNQLAQNGHLVHYLTGRDRKNMELGTIESLKQHGFPLADVKHLIMKSEKGILEDEDFKVIELRKLLLQNKMIIFFENEPVIIHEVLKKLPQVEIVFLNTTHSGKAQPPENVTTMIGHYGFEN